MLRWDTWSILLSCAAFVFTSMICWRSYTKKGKQPPGPFSWPITGCLPNLALSFYRSGKRLPAFLDSLARYYGPVFRVNLCGTNIIVLSDYNSIKQAFQHPSLNDRPLSSLRISEIFGGDGKYTN